MLYLRNICRLETEGAYSLNYIDDFVITVTLNSAKSNYKKLKGIALELISRAKEAAISFDISKTELIHFYSKRTTIEEGLKLGDVETSPNPLFFYFFYFFFRSDCIILRIILRMQPLGYGAIVLYT